MQIINDPALAEVWAYEEATGGKKKFNSRPGDGSLLEREIDHFFSVANIFGFRRRTERFFDLLGARWRYADPIQLIAATDLANPFH